MAYMISYHIWGLYYILSYGDISNAVTLSRPKFNVVLILQSQHLKRTRIYLLLVWFVMTCSLKQALPDEWSLSCFFNSILDDLAQRKSCWGIPNHDIPPWWCFCTTLETFQHYKRDKLTNLNWCWFSATLTMTVVSRFWFLVMLNFTIKNHAVFPRVFPKIGVPKSSILMGLSHINHPFWGTTIFWKQPYGISHLWLLERTLMS